MMRAPSPVLICAATTDFFNINGTWDSFRCAKRLFTRMGFSANVDLLENDAGHNYDTLQREGAARWLVRWLLSKDEPIVEPPITLLTEQEYQCTPDGRVMSLPEARSAYDLNEEYERTLAAQRAATWADGDRVALLDQVRRMAGIRKLAELPKPTVETLDTLTREGCKIEKLLIHPEDGILLPALFFLPEKPRPDAVVLYVHEQGKAADAGGDGPIERLVRDGHAVLAVDVRGTGQTQAEVAKDGGYSPEYQDAHIAYMLGRSYVGMRTEDVLVCARYAAERITDGKERTVRLMAFGHVGVPALHAVALEPHLFCSAKLSRSLGSWANVIQNRLSKNMAVNLVHGALTHYDLPDLAATVTDRLTVENPVDSMGVVIDDGGR